MTLEDKSNKQAPQFTVDEYQEIRDRIQEANNDINTRDLTVNGTFNGGSSDGTFNTITADATSSGDIPLTLIQHDETGNSIFIDFRNESGGSESSVGRITYDATNDELQIENIELTASSGGSMSFEDDKLLHFGTDNDTSIAYDSTDDRTEIRTSKSVRVEDSSSNELLSIETDGDVIAPNRIRVGSSGTPSDPLDVDGSSNFNGNAQFNDDIQVQFGAAPDYWFVYDSSNTRLQLRSTDIDGGGTDGTILRVGDGQQDVDFLSDISFPNIGGTPTFSGHDHSESGMTTVPNSGLTNSSITISAGTGIDSAGSVSLGGSVTVAVGFSDDEDLDFGTGDDYNLRYDSANTQLELESADIDGGGTSGNILRVADGQQDVEFISDISFPNITGTPTFSGHDHSEGGMSTVPNAGLTNSSVSFTAGTGIATDGDGTLVLGGSGETLSVVFADDEQLTFGASDDWILQYDSTNTRFEITDGTNDLVRIDDGTTIVDFPNDIDVAGTASLATIDNDGSAITVSDTIDANAEAQIERPYGQGGAHNVETLSGGKTLSVTDPEAHLLDPGGSNRTVTLPAEGNADGKAFFIKNTADASESLSIDNDGGTTIATVGQNEATYVICDGTSWETMGVWTITQS